MPRTYLVRALRALNRGYRRSRSDSNPAGDDHPGEQGQQQRQLTATAAGGVGSAGSQRPRRDALGGLPDCEFANNDCASGIVRRFLHTLAPGDVSCAARTAEIHVVPEFPRRADQAWAAAWAAGDALARWWLMSGADGHGLRGGTFVAEGDYLSYEPIRLRLRGVRFVEGVPVSGIVVWDRRAGTVRARLRVPEGSLRIGWSTRAPRALASVRGTLAGHPVRLRMPAP
jgi:hypothetical protein